MIPEKVHVSRNKRYYLSSSITSQVVLMQGKLIVYYVLWTARPWVSHKKKNAIHCFSHRDAHEKDYITMKNYYDRNKYKVSEIQKKKLYYSNI